MPTKVEKDAITGTDTTGHEWDGIKELNTPLPKWWLYVFYVTVIFSVIYWLLYPAIPGISGYTKGIIGGSAREALVEKMAAAQERQSAYLSRFETIELEEIRADADLLNFSLAGGRAAFADNCAPCHGLGGAGRPGGYPVLADDDWIWGGTLEEIHTTLLHGIRHESDETRDSQMPAFGADELLTGEEIDGLAEYVLSLAGADHDASKAAAAAELYVDNCAACHAEDGAGEMALGAPRLNDQIWLYGGEKADIVTQISAPRHGVMPAWSTRLDDATIKMLTVYVHSLGGGQ
ncbi:MAG: cytochrome-c oxidase, cbb3-type subunit III [Kiloniellales bacterium]|nr:cytochrome-c oxidase, cbb3-type subunit III [Kiloniellales bacterium]